jgi:hypothetical protein
VNSAEEAARAFSAFSNSAVSPCRYQPFLISFSIKNHFMTGKRSRACRNEEVRIEKRAAVLVQVQRL